MGLHDLDPDSSQRRVSGAASRASGNPERPVDAVLVE
jgi:hypothetical protein